MLTRRPERRYQFNKGEKLTLIQIWSIIWTLCVTYTTGMQLRWRLNIFTVGLAFQFVIACSMQKAIKSWILGRPLKHTILRPNSYIWLCCFGNRGGYKRGLFYKCFQKRACIISCPWYTTYLRLVAITTLLMIAATCLIAQIDTSSLLTFVFVPDSVSISVPVLLTIWQLNIILVLPMAWL